MTTVNKKVNLNLIGLDGNAFSLMGAFSKQAKKEGWDKSEIDAVLEEAQSNDYSHLLSTLQSHCDITFSEDESEDDNDWEDDDED